MRGSVPAVIAPWERFVIGLDKALEQFWRDNPNGVLGAPARDAPSDRAGSPPAADAPAQGAPTNSKIELQPDSSAVEPDRMEEPEPTCGVDAIDSAVHSLWGGDAPPDRVSMRLRRSPALPESDSAGYCRLRAGGDDQPDLR